MGISMLKRKVDTLLQSWKEKPDHKALILQGARQVGKTYSVREFGKENYAEYVEINFKEMPDADTIFRGNLDVDTMLLGLRFRFPQNKFPEKNTLIFLDEIQECPEAITSLKFWTIDGRFDVIASGSLLGIDYKRPTSYPVGYVSYLRMFALDFEEFLWAKGIDAQMIGALRLFFINRQMVPEAVNRQMMDLFRVFVSIGGMPEVVQSYIDTGFFTEPYKRQQELLQGYYYDIAHYAPAAEKIKAENCYRSIARQLLAKENHKFQYKEVEKKGTARKYGSSIDWLIAADMAVKCFNVTSPEKELEDYEISDNFRVYTTDIGMITGARNFSLKQDIIEARILGNTAGGIYEAAIADVLIKKGLPLHFLKDDQKNLEIEFLAEIGEGIVPIEVKAGRNKATSMIRMMKKHPEIRTAYKFTDGNVGVSNEGVVTMPHYMAMFL